MVTAELRLRTHFDRVGVGSGACDGVAEGAVARFTLQSEQVAAKALAGGLFVLCSHGALEAVEQVLLIVLDRVLSCRSHATSPNARAGTSARLQTAGRGGE